MSRSEGREARRRGRARFRRIVADAVDDLIAEIERRRDEGTLSAGIAGRYLDAIAKVGVVTEDEPDARQRAETEDADTLLGLYEGVPLTEWGADQATLPARITIFRHATEAISPSPRRQRDEVRKTVKHEIGHHLGWSDKQLDALGLGDAD